MGEEEGDCVETMEVIETSHGRESKREGSHSVCAVVGHGLSAIKGLCHQGTIHI